MNFRTQVELPKRETEIRHSDRIMLFGSCFAENIGNLLLANKFRCDVNPFGILYNPLSIVEALWQILSHQTYTEEDLFYAGGCWHSWMHHSVFSASTAVSCLSSINTRLEQASAGLAVLQLNLCALWRNDWNLTFEKACCFDVFDFFGVDAQNVVFTCHF